MAITSDRLSAVIGEVYAAVGTPEGFGSLLRQLRVLLNASSGMLFTPFVDPGAGGFGFVEHLNPALFSQYRAYYWDKDPWAAACERMGLMKTGSTFSDATLIAQSVAAACRAQVREGQPVARDGDTASTAYATADWSPGSCNSPFGKSDGTALRRKPLAHRIVQIDAGRMSSRGSASCRGIAQGDRGPIRHYREHGANPDQIAL